MAICIIQMDTEVRKRCGPGSDFVGLCSDGERPSLRVVSRAPVANLVRPSQSATDHTGGLLHISVEKAPSPGVDFGVTVLSQPLDVVLHVPFIRQMTRFFGVVSGRGALRWY
jgi:hypothetical protein